MTIRNRRRFHGAEFAPHWADENGAWHSVLEGPALLVAASDAPSRVKRRAWRVCDGTADDAEIQAAIDALPASGGRVELSAGTFTLASQVARAIDNVTFQGAGAATLLNLDASTVPISAGTQLGWRLIDINTDLGDAPYLVRIVKVIDHADLTDVGDATAFIDFDDTIPAGSIIQAVKCDFTEAFNSDDTTTLTMMIGIPTDLDDFNLTAAPGENAFNHTTDVRWGESGCQDPVVVAAVIPRVTFTEDNDGTDIISSANAAGGVTITITYLKA